MGQLGRPEQLNLEHTVSQFSCGDIALDRWLKDSAIKAGLANTARTFVISYQSRVIGYYALANGALLRAQMPIDLATSLPHHPIPILLLARLAIDKEFQGTGLGGALVKDAVLRAKFVSEHSGLVALVAHAKTEKAAGFYSHLGFYESPISEKTMILPLSTLEK